MSDRIARLRPLGESAAGTWPQTPWYRSPRARLFSVVFVVVLLSGCLFTLFQETTWRSKAVVLISSPATLDDADPVFYRQDVEIQSRVLLGPEVMEALTLSLREDGIDPGDWRRLLDVTPVDDTNVVEMSAEGGDRELMPLLVNRWIDVYLGIRSDEDSRRKAYTLEQVEDQLSGLDIKVAEAREALAAYRREHDIISAQREENEVLARLDGLNAALNKALEDEVQTRARLDTLRTSIRRGERVVPRDQLSDVTRLEQELQELRAELTELEQRYTQQYIDKQPQFRAVVDRIAELEVELDEAYEDGRNSELAAARQDHATAQRATLELRDQLSRHRDKVADFTEIYATHEALVEDLARLEELNRDSRERQVQVELRDLDKFPRVSVIQRAPAESERTGPDYLLLMAISTGLGFALGLVAVWLRGFLGHDKPEPGYISVELVPPQPTPGAELPYDAREQIGRSSTPRLESSDDGVEPR